MSWSFQAIGSPDKVVDALEAHSEAISKNPADLSRAEFDEAKPHLIALVKQNFVEASDGRSKPFVKITASGSASLKHSPGEAPRKTYSSCAVQLESLYGYVG